MNKFQVTVKDLPKLTRVSGELGTVKVTRHQIECPECGQKIIGVAHDGIISGWCGVHGKRVTMRVEEA